MSVAFQLLRSILFNTQMYVALALIGLACGIPAMVSRDYALAGVHAYCRWVRWTARWMVGLGTEVRGTVPQSEVLVAAKHQSFLDIILIVSVLPRPRFIMKAELTRAPILGFYARRIGCIPVKRGRRGQAIKKMRADVAAGRRRPGQLVIYPQGTRIAPGTTAPYKIGTAVLYEQMNRPCIPAATNVGVFWPKRGIMRKPGRAVVEFLEPIAPGLAHDAFMTRLEHEIEGTSDRLAAEAGFRPRSAAD